MAKKILFPTDYSEASQNALPFATSLARDWEAKLLVMHVADREQYPVGELFDEEPETPADAVAELEQVVPGDPDVACEHELVFGPPSSEIVKPADEILKLAEQRHVAAIVMGTHGRTGMGRLMMGSVAESVVRQASCPVVTIKQPSGESP